eukprot:7933667-Pyramimonas_sp.AAC.1
MAKRVIDDVQLIGPDDMKMLTAPINQSRNSRARQCGASPCQWTFGKDPRIPDSITDPANSAVVHSAMAGDAELAKRVRVRTLADLAFTEYDRSESLKRSMLRVNRPYRGDYTAGDRVAFWRLPKAKKGKHFPASEVHRGDGDRTWQQRRTGRQQRLGAVIWPSYPGLEGASPRGPRHRDVGPRRYRPG